MGDHLVDVQIAGSLREVDAVLRRSREIAVLVAGCIDGEEEVLVGDGAVQADQVDFGPVEERVLIHRPNGAVYREIQIAVHGQNLVRRHVALEHL